MNKLILIKIIILSFLTSITFGYIVVPFCICKEIYKKITWKNLNKIYVILFNRKAV